MLYVTQTGPRYMLGRRATSSDAGAAVRGRRTSRAQEEAADHSGFFVSPGQPGWIAAITVERADERRSQACGDRRRRFRRLADRRRARGRTRRSSAPACRSPCSNRRMSRPIGVGEGTWPTMRDTLRRIGVTETDFIRECDASFKQGSKFVGWVDGRGDDHYFHPFVLPQGYARDQPGRAAGWRGTPTCRSPTWSASSRTCARRAGRPSRATPEFAAVANYAYHLDAGKFGLFLRRHCIERAGRAARARPRDRRRTSHDNGDIASLQTARAGALAGDLFVDCTGMQLAAAGQALRRRRSCRSKHVLFNDSALAVQVPYADADSPIASQTISTAQSSGWIWDIGLPTPARRRPCLFERAQPATTRPKPSCGTTSSRPAARRSSRAAAQAVVRAWLSREVLASQLRRDRPVRGLHRAAGGFGAGPGRVVGGACSSDEMPATRAAWTWSPGASTRPSATAGNGSIDFLKLHYVLTQAHGSGILARQSPAGVDPGPAA